MSKYMININKMSHLADVIFTTYAHKSCRLFLILIKTKFDIKINVSIKT